MQMPGLEVLFGICAEKLAALIHDKAAAILGVKEELGKLQRRMDRIDCALKDAGWRRTDKEAATTTSCWLSELKSILHEAGDVFDDCRSEGGKLLDNELPSASSGLSILRRIPLISDISSVLVRNKIADRIRKLNDRIDEVAKDAWILNLEQEITRKAGGSHGSAERVSELLPILSWTLAGRSIFLVLDDVWQSDVWTDLLRNPLQNGAASGCILVTTRDQNVAMRMGAKHIHQVEKMTVDSGWELLCKKTYLEEDAQSLRSVGVQIVNKCGGLPLAIKVIAGVLTTKEKSRKEWERVLKSNAWSMSELPEEFRGALYLSYDDLPPHLKQCFLSLCLYPEDDVHSIRDLRRMWVAEGFVNQEEGSIMEELAEQYYFELIRRSLLQPHPLYVDQGRCRIHDLLRSLGQYLSRGESYYGDSQSLDATAISKLRRLSIAESEEIVTIPGSETEQLRLRTLLLTKSPPRIEHNLFSRVPYLQVLILNGKGIECVPDSVANLIHLRLLDLDRTSISMLPCSIGSLTNLQTLNLQHCEFLNTLPRSITHLCSLRRLGLLGLQLCSQLPPLGQLPHLRYLQIREALAIVTIGPELLGNGVGDGVHAATVFPKLEFLILVNMPNWEEWSLVGSETGNSSSRSLRVMPRLEVLRVRDCPKLRALPNGLQQLRALRIFNVARAHSLSVIKDFLFITELKIEMNNGIERVSNLPGLKKLTIWDTPALKCVDNLVALQCLELQDYSRESIPEWLLRLVQQRLHLRDNNLQLVMRCSAAVIQRCLKGGPDWPIIACFSRVSAYTEDRSAYLEYTKQTGCYRTNQ
uniref:Disease resistance protein RGA3 n=1 Tax=Ananas comosus var. bracteatus TaxID=296719 RepID=A0A6V7QLP2_ANACO|nr:unnamed protein product [Ananas comosus var. bracteatus]